MESILNALLTYSVLESSPSDEPDIEKSSAAEQNGDFAERINDLFGQTNNGDSDQKIDADSDFWSSDYDENIPEELSDSDSCFGMEETSGTFSEKEQKLSFLADMGYPKEEVSIAIERCGPDSSLEELADFLCAAQMARASDASYVDPPKPKVVYCFLVTMLNIKRGRCLSMK